MRSLYFSVRSNRLLIPACASLAIALGACGDEAASPGGGPMSGVSGALPVDAGTAVFPPATAGGGTTGALQPGADAGAIQSSPLGGAAPVDAGVSATPGGGNVQGPGSDGSVAQVDAGGASPWPSDCEEHHVFRAHNKNGVDDTSKKVVAPGGQYYASYYYRAPWTRQEVQGLQFRSIIDNKKIVHHWILYGVNSGTQQDGAVQGGPGQPIGTMQGEFYIAGWAPGAPDITLPDGVGLHLPTGASATFRLEVHYYNTSPGAVSEEDASGVEFCVTSHKRPAEAAIHWMGTTNIRVPAYAKTDLHATCRPQITNGPVHLISLSSHMHKTGVHSSAILKRANGGAPVTLIDDPFSFMEQAGYREPRDGSAPDVLINAGDTIDVTCSYDNTSGSAKTFGSNTEDEMCFFYAMAWPRGQLQNGSFFSIVPGAEPEVNCIE